MAANAKEEKKGGKRQTAKKTAATKKTGGGKKVSRGKKTTGGFRWWKLLFFAALAVGAPLALYVGYCFATLPDIEQAVSRTRQPSTSIIAENGQEIATFGNVYSEVVYPDELPPYVINAVIATEDRRFYSHFGFDVIAFTRAMTANLIKGRYAQGGSTITQQVAKNLFLTPQKNIKRKVQELLMAFWLESKFSKDQILTLYLNRVYMGSGTYGIEAASQKYFHKSSRDLNMLEGAVIAGLLKAPARYNPAADKERALKRAAVVLQNMVNAAVITLEQKAKALKMPIGAGIHDKLEGGRYFADWVYQEVNAYIGERENDINVYTTLDKKIQKAAESALRQAVFANAKSKSVTNGAVVVLDRNGAVKAMAGGINYEKSQFNRATQALRQPGSAFKTFVYLTALEEGWDTDDEIDDYPITIGNWKPENYSKKYYGTVTLEEAFVRSLNLATVNLAQKLPSGDIIRTARKMGISTPIDDTPAMVLGSSAVKVLDMAVAYTAVANGGYAAWPYSITEIYTREGYPLYTRLYDEDERQRILDEDTVEAMTEMMEKVILEGTGKRAQLPFFAAGKTGTSQDYRDAWFVGFTDRYVAAVWVGNDDNSPMKGVGGGTLPAEIWKKVMLAAESEEDKQNETKTRNAANFGRLGLPQGNYPRQRDRTGAYAQLAPVPERISALPGTDLRTGRRPAGRTDGQFGSGTHQPRRRPGGHAGSAEDRPGDQRRFA